MAPAVYHAVRTDTSQGNNNLEENLNDSSPLLRSTSIGSIGGGGGGENGGGGGGEKGGMRFEREGEATMFSCISNLCNVSN